MATEEIVRGAALLTRKVRPDRKNQGEVGPHHSDVNRAHRDLRLVVVADQVKIRARAKITSRFGPQIGVRFGRGGIVETEVYGRTLRISAVSTRPKMARICEAKMGSYFCAGPNAALAGVDDPEQEGAGSFQELCRA